MLEWWNNLSLTVFDTLMGWSLDLPRDLTILIIAIGSAGILTFVRLFTTNQDLLGRADNDKKRQKALLAEAKKRGDKEAAARHRAIIPLIAMKTFKQEGLPLLVSILPIAMLATWALARLDRLPPEAGEPVEVVAYTPPSAIGEPIHIVPAEGVEVEAKDGAPKSWVRVVEEDKDAAGRVVNGVARWTVEAKASAKPYELEIRARGGAVEQPLAVGGRTYAEPLILHDSPAVTATELKMREARFLGFVPGIPWLAFPAWLVAYLIIVIPFVFVIKRVFRIY